MNTGGEVGSTSNSIALFAAAAGLFALAGGYKWGGLTLQQVAELHLETVKAFAA